MRYLNKVVYLFYIWYWAFYNAWLCLIQGHGHFGKQAKTVNYLDFQFKVPLLILIPYMKSFFACQQGKRKEPNEGEKSRAKFYHIRSSGGILAKRVIEVYLIYFVKYW